MEIGGYDNILEAPVVDGVGDVVLHLCRQYWPNEECYFEDVNEIGCRPLSDPTVWKTVGDSKEFFVYQNLQAYESWEKDGATAKNANAMFHFLIGETPDNGVGPVEVTFVCGRINPKIRRLIKDLTAGFQALGDTQAKQTN